MSYMQTQIGNVALMDADKEKYTFWSTIRFLKRI